MNKKESRRIVPVSVVVSTLVAALVVLEVLVISGAFEVKGATVARFAPWAYETFLRIVGEHPDSPAHPMRGASADAPAPLSAMDVVASFDADAILADTNENVEAESSTTSAVPETATPDEPVQEEPPREVVPVG